MEIHFNNIEIIFGGIASLALIFIPFLFNPFKELFYGYENTFRGILIVFSIMAIIIFVMYLLPQASIFESPKFIKLVFFGICLIVPVFLLSILETRYLAKGFKIFLILLFYLIFSITFLIFVLFFVYKSSTFVNQFEGEVSNNCRDFAFPRIGIYRPDYSNGQLKPVVDSQPLNQSIYLFLISQSIEIKSGDIIATYSSPDGLHLAKLKDAYCTTIIETTKKDKKYEFDYAHKITK